ncbi:MAG TPA: hypothetical protein VFH83_01755 [Spirochaetia bacterium]|nr:hypothetical protein [Spirochaetia bacterium]
MPPLAKRIALLVALFSLVIGLFLLGYNLQLISDPLKSTVVNLWPLLLVIAGIMLVLDSSRKRAITRASGVRSRSYPISVSRDASELELKVQFAYGRLVLGAGGDCIRLVTEQMDPAEPTITQDVVGERAEVSIAMSQPLFPSHFQLRNSWKLELTRDRPLRMSLLLHEADLRMDLRGMDIESLELRSDSGVQEIRVGRPRKKLSGRIYSSGGTLSLLLPARAFAWVKLLNPFCRVDYPQGDLERREDGSLITPARPDALGNVELSIDGPIRNLVLDIDDEP